MPRLTDETNTKAVDMNPRKKIDTVRTEEPLKVREGR